jgi:glyoxalase-like protein
VSAVSENDVRLRQAALAAWDLDAVAGRLRAELGLGEPFADPGVAGFGLRNAVFALGDTFLEVVSPAEDGTAAGRWLDRLGGDGGYMLMFQIADLDRARARVRALGIREVFAVDLEDIVEAHLHPADVGGAIVSLSRPTPQRAWRWGGPGWEERSAAAAVAGVEVTVSDPAGVAARWREVLGVDPEAVGVEFAGGGDRGPTAIRIRGRSRSPVEIGGVRFEFA